MSFFTPSAELSRIGALIETLAAERFAERGVPPENFAYVLLHPNGPSEAPSGAALRAERQAYPCSLVKVFFLVAAQVWLERGAIQPHEELDRAMRDMILVSSNAATNYIIDLVTGTTGDTLLDQAAMAEWLARRQEVNRFFEGLGWPELAGINLDQKLMDDRRYGRERFALDRSPTGHNSLSPIAIARLMHEIFHGGMLPPARMTAIRDLLVRDPRHPLRVRPQYQLMGYLGGDLPEGTRIWSKAGRTRWLGDERAEFRRHDTLRSILPGGAEFLLTVFTEGEAIVDDDTLLPAIGALVAREITGGRA